MKRTLVLSALLALNAQASDIGKELNEFFDAHVRCTVRDFSEIGMGGGTEFPPTESFLFIPFHEQTKTVTVGYLKATVRALPIPPLSGAGGMQFVADLRGNTDDRRASATVSMDNVIPKTFALNLTAPDSGRVMGNLQCRREEK